MVLNSKISTVEELLSSHGPLPSSEIKRYLIASGISEEAARQRISRANGTVRRLSTIKLPKKESFLFLDKQFGSFEYWAALINAHSRMNSSYGVAIQSILARGGVIPLKHFEIVCGSPQKLSKHLSSSVVLSKLVACKLLKEIEDPVLGKCLVIDAQNHLSVVSLASKRVSLLIEDIIISAVRDWLRKIGIASYNAIATRHDVKLPSFGQYSWDLTAPSYIYPLAEMSKKLIPGFVVADIVNGALNEEHVKYFVSKCRTNRHLNKMRPFLALLVAERFTKEAYKVGKSEGILFTTPDILFGTEIAESLIELTKTLNNAAAVAATDPGKISKLFSSLTKIEGAAINLRGALFELIVGHLVLQGEGNSIDIGVKVTDPEGNSAEIDVRRVKGTHEVALYECKGRQPTTLISKKEVEKWVTDRVPIIRKALMMEPRFREAKMIFEYWTTGQFSEDALNLLMEYQSKTNKYSIGWKAGHEVLSYAKNINSTSMVEVLKQHYMNHPLS